MTNIPNPLDPKHLGVLVTSHTFDTQPAASFLGQMLHLLFRELDTIPPEMRTSEWCWSRLKDLAELQPSSTWPSKDVVIVRTVLREIYGKTHPKSPPES